MKDSLTLVLVAYRTMVGIDNLATGHQSEAVAFAFGAETLDKELVV